MTLKDLKKVVLCTDKIKLYKGKKNIYNGMFGNLAMTEDEMNKLEVEDLIASNYTLVVYVL